MKIIISKNGASLSSVQFAIDYECKIAYILDIRTHKRHRGKGYATYILNYTKKYLKEKGIKSIELDDMSDNAWKDNNLYINTGFKYIDEYPNPEMSIDL